MIIDVLLSVGFVLLHIGAAMTLMISERRAPTATVAWLMTLVFLPGLGLLLYWAIGRTKARRVAKSYRRVVDQLQTVLEKYDVHRKLSEAGEDPIDPRTEALLALGGRLSTLPASRGNEVEILADAKAAYISMRDAINEAQHHVHVEFYIIQNDITGQALRDLLTKRARAGVEVRVVCDGLGSGKLPGDFWQPLIDAGGAAHEFRPVANLLTRLPFRDRLDFRNHRKLVIVDGRVGFTGGINVGREYLGLDPEVGYWRDTHMRIRGPATLCLQKAFAEDWLQASDQLLDDGKYFPDPAGHDHGPYSVQVIDSGPDRQFSPISFLYVQAFALARERIWITSPYFIPNPSIEQGLIAAALRGVDVRLLVPLHPDHKIVMAAGASYFPELLEAGVKIYRYRRGFVHAKTLVVDDWVGSIGSANMDVRSFHLNYELNALVYGHEFCTAMASQFEADLENAEAVTLEAEQRLGVATRLLRSSARMLSPLL